MLAIVGAAGNVGYSTILALRENGAAVRAILRDANKAARLEAMGCEVAVADLQQPASLIDAMAGADAVQIVVPLRPTAADPVADMRRSVDSLVAALAAARPARILAVSDYGAHVPDDIGLPSVFRDLEAKLARLDGCKVVLRSAEHMHNLARIIPAALKSGAFPTFQDPVTLVQPTIAARDLGRIAAELLLRDRASGWEVVHAEGPRRYSAADTADVLSELSGRRITARAIPRAAWQEILERTMPRGLAALISRTNEAKNEGGLIDVDPNAGDVRYGTTELIDALRPFTSR